MAALIGSNFTAVGLKSLFVGLPTVHPGRALGLKLALLPSSSVEGDEGWESEVVRLGLEVNLRGGGPLRRTELWDPAAMNQA